MIYYGFDFSSLEMIDSIGIKADTGNNHLISVSMSGYQGALPYTVHNEIMFLAKEVYSKKYSAAFSKNSYLHWKNGYKNSMTYIDGFGVCDLPEYNVFGENRKNTRIGQKVTAVLDNTIRDQLMNFDEVKIHQKHEEEYLSLALHPYVREINPDLILGWIVDETNFEDVKSKMKRGEIADRETWLVSEI
ncbi:MULTISPECIES: hypothetical protein [unclassified Oceanispirochaeta]|uniref:hypothetical protein n=1 Tax=unclassified Oceanispirochaeta TaxID=2635722 RepID=UPI000E09C60C|nr:MULTISPECIES: hypothetical protein [unclassified Oceanispirochaeta]MBF9018808.1 hypothetical protein [Oceanispirochaeta sp. M2]NPD75277.1 hypothetical protein [Oceanispirochaeta sp. M1]RDG28868.1 hypothetical protein DV872_24600 [Oceanispirochaeta sp. M1]